MKTKKRKKWNVKKDNMAFLKDIFDDFAFIIYLNGVFFYFIIFGPRLLREGKAVAGIKQENGIGGGR